MLPLKLISFLQACTVDTRHTGMKEKTADEANRQWVAPLADKVAKHYPKLSRDKAPAMRVNSEISPVKSNLKSTQLIAFMPAHTPFNYPATLCSCKPDH